MPLAVCSPQAVGYAYFGADLGALVEKFRARGEEAFGSPAVNLGREAVADARLLAWKHEGLTFPQIVNRYRQENPEQFPEQPGTPEYEERGEVELDRLRHRAGRFDSKLKDAVDRVDGGTSESR